MVCYKLGWAAARMPMVGIPKEPHLLNLSQPGRGGPRGLPLPWGLEAGPDRAGHPLRSTRGWGWEAARGQRSRGQRRQQPAAGLWCHWPEPPAAFPIPPSATPAYLSWGQAYGGSRQGWRWPQGLRRPLPPLEGLGISRGMSGQVGVSPAPFPLRGPGENSPFTQPPQ